MIDIFHASEQLQTKLQQSKDERSLMKLVASCLDNYQFATQVKCAELDIAFAATGGKTNWVNADNTSIAFEPLPNRATTFGDLLIEHPHNYINLATPAGFIPLVDLIYTQGQLSRKQIN